MILLKLFTARHEVILDGHRFIHVEEIYGKWFATMMAVFIFMFVIMFASGSRIMALMLLCWGALIIIYGIRISVSKTVLRKSFTDSDTRVLLTRKTLDQYINTFVPSDGYLIVWERGPLHELNFNCKSKFWIDFCDEDYDWRHQCNAFCDFHKPMVVAAVTTKENATLLRIMN